MRQVSHSYKYVAHDDNCRRPFFCWIAFSSSLYPFWLLLLSIWSHIRVVSLRHLLYSRFCCPYNNYPWKARTKEERSFQLYLFKSKQRWHYTALTHTHEHMVIIFGAFPIQKLFYAKIMLPSRRRSGDRDIFTWIGWEKRTSNNSNKENVKRTQN